MISKPSNKFIKELEERQKNNNSANPDGLTLIRWMELHGYVVVSKRRFTFLRNFFRTTYPYNDLPR